MNTAQRILKNTTSLLAGGVTAQVLNFVALVYLARVLGPEGFGKINFAMALVIYFTLLADLGLPLLGTREVARGKDKIRDYVGSIVTLRLFLSVLSFCLLFLLAALLNLSATIKYLIILYGLGLISNALLFEWILQGIERMEYIGASRVLKRAIFVSLVVLFIKGNDQILLVPLFEFIAAFLGALMLIFFSIRYVGLPRPEFDLGSWQSFIRQAFPIGLSMIMIQMIYYIDTAMLGFMEGDEEVGYYNAAYKIILFLIMVIAAYHDAIFPVISLYYKTSLDSLKRIQSYTIKLMMTLAWPLAVGGTVIAAPLMNMIYGDKYSDSIIAFQLLIWVVLIIYANTVYARGLWACDKQDDFLKIVFIQFMTNLLFNFMLIPPLGVKGAAMAKICAEAVGFFLYYRSFAKVVEVPFHTYLLRPLIACGAMTLFLQLGLKGLNLNVISLILGGVFLYFLFLYLLKGMTNEDFRLVRDAILRSE